MISSGYRAGINKEVCMGICLEAQLLAMAAGGTEGASRDRASLTNQEVGISQPVAGQPPRSIDSKHHGCHCTGIAIEQIFKQVNCVLIFATLKI